MLPSSLRDSARQPGFQTSGRGGLGSTKFVAFETLAWHNECFFCARCKLSMVGKGFIQDGGNIVCPECARQKMLQEMEDDEQEE
eukprot:snap_masked-scaffold28_size608977-processed-gene-1.8 protein:Tk05744 transcript:snap_masked-scaffold28_size608977-processed-gene-1.8-mRNA-1 annotation:"lim and cysteine-rich domains protein 1"